MPTMSTIEIGSVFAGFKGEPGTRKSTCALSFPGPQFWASYDQKMNALAIPMKNWGIDPKTIEYEDYIGWEPFRLKLEKLRTNCPFKTIIVDSVTSLGDSAIRETMKVKGQGGGGKKVGNTQVAGFDEFNAETSALMEMIALLKDIKSYHKINIILIAHVIQVDQKDKDGETHVSRTIVTAAKKVAAKIPAYCDEVYHFNIKKGGFDINAGGQYALLTEHTGQDFARTALPLQKEIVFGNDPLYSKWIKPAIEELKKQPQTTKF